jgi:ESS family glutamate:Na+ symporter
MFGSMDKMTVQIAFIAGAYLLAFGLMYGLGLLLPGMKSVIFGFNFLLGVLAATIIKAVMNWLNKRKIIRRKQINDFLMTRASNCCFDVMVVAGIAVIRLDIVEKYWGILAIMGVLGAVATFWYTRKVAVSLFPGYVEEQFLTTYGMLTGTASTGVILLREIDGRFETPAADNMVYQNFPAIVFGFPMMLLATLAPQKPYLTFGILVAFFIAMNILLFRSKIFGKKSKTK